MRTLIGLRSSLEMEKEAKDFLKEMIRYLLHTEEVRERKDANIRNNLF